MSTAKPTGGKSGAAKEPAKKTTARTTASKTTAKTTKTTAKTTAAAAKAPAKRTTRATAAKVAAAAAEVKREPRRQVKTGRVVSNKMEKTIVVAVESLKRHRLYKRTYKSTTKFKAHDEHNEALIGDLVRIEETRPMSKDKRWRLIEIAQRAVQAPSVAQVVAQLDPEAEGR